MYAPIIRNARRHREHILGANHTAILLTDIENVPNPDAIEYAHLLALFERGNQDPVAFISSEVKRTASIAELLGLEEDELEDLADLVEPDDEEGSHFLCAFIDDGHRNFGAAT